MVWWEVGIVWVGGRVCIGCVVVGSILGGLVCNGWVGGRVCTG